MYNIMNSDKKMKSKDNTYSYYKANANFKLSHKPKNQKSATTD